MRRALVLLVTAAMAVLTGCGGGGGAAPTAGPSGAPSAGQPGAASPGTASPGAGTSSGAFTLTSSAFRNGQPIPKQYTCQGDGTSPPLAWSGVPPKATTLALFVDDPDAVGGRYVHWVVSDIPVKVTGVAAGQSPPGGTVTRNSNGDTSYLGPCPPGGSGVHRYRFTLYAMPQQLRLPPDTPPSEAEAAFQHGALARIQLTGTYQVA